MGKIVEIVEQDYDRVKVAFQQEAQDQKDIVVVGAQWLNPHE